MFFNPEQVRPVWRVFSEIIRVGFHFFSQNQLGFLVSKPELFLSSSGYIDVYRFVYIKSDFQADEFAKQAFKPTNEGIDQDYQAGVY